MSSVQEPISENLSTQAPALDLHEIQATVLRPRPAPYFGSYILLRIDDAQAGRAFLGRLAPYVDSAADWWKAANAWLAVGISYAGLQALGVPQESLQSFPEAFREGMAARARHLGDEGVNDPKNWEQAYGKNQVHIGITAFSDSEEKRRIALAMAREQYEGFSGVSVLAMQDFGAQPGDLNSLGYKDGIDQPPIEGSGVDPLPGQGRPIKAGAFNRFLQANGSTDEERELLAAKLVGRWRSGAPLTLAPEVDNPAIGADPHRNNDFNYSNDPRGRQAPFGCHIRRMNPRDSKLTRLTDVNLHRVIRRGTTYGPPYDPNALSEADDQVPRGAYFLFISAKAMATIEFLQQEWVNDGNFIGIGDERDPIIGLQEEGAVFTIPKDPVRRRAHGIETFNVLRGGEYFFMPSLSALRWLSELR